MTVERENDMTPEEKKDKFDDLASRLLEIRKELEQLNPLPENPKTVDDRAVKSIVADLNWAVENCTVLGLHAVGKKLDDTMGL